MASTGGHSAEAAGVAALTEAGKQVTGMPKVRQPGSLVSRYADPRKAESRPGWGVNRR